MVVYIARHAWAGERGDPRWPDDSLRELTPDGIKRYTKMVKALAERGFEPVRIATSPYTRCRQTADIISLNVTPDASIDALESLEPGFELDPLLEWTNRERGDVCWVGHSPDVEELAAALISDGDARFRFAKGAVAAIFFDDKAEAGAGTLYWLATAKSLGV
jgi:phosphohistidine phosphatase SixA